MASFGKSAVLDTAILNLIFKGIAHNQLAINDTAAASGGVLSNLFVSLHSSSPDTTGNQGTNELSYTGYARQAVLRTTTGGWTVVGASASPQATISFGTGTNTTTVVASFFAVGTTVTGSGTVFYFGTLTPTISISSGILPQMTTGSSIQES